MKKAMTKKNYIVQVGWVQSINKGADGEYTKAQATKIAKLQQAKSITGLRYRVKEVK
jgi:hypothetical protein